MSSFDVFWTDKGSLIAEMLSFRVSLQDCLSVLLTLAALLNGLVSSQLGMFLIIISFYSFKRHKILKLSSCFQTKKKLCHFLTTSKSYWTSYGDPKLISSFVWDLVTLSRTMPIRFFPTSWTVPLAGFGESTEKIWMKFQLCTTLPAFKYGLLFIPLKCWAHGKGFDS